MKKTKILIIDDSAALRASLRDMLPSSTEVIEAADGIEGLKQVQANPPNLILLDCQMPQMDGIEVFRRLQNHARFRRIPVVLMSGSKDEVVPLLNRLPMEYEFLSKPFKPEQLLRSSHEAMKRARQLPAPSPQPSADVASKPQTQSVDSATVTETRTPTVAQESTVTATPTIQSSSPTEAMGATQGAESDGSMATQRLQQEVQHLRAQNARLEQDMQQLRSQNTNLEQDMRQLRQQVIQIVKLLRSPSPNKTERSPVAV